MEERSNTASVPAFLAKLWRLVEDEDTNNLIYWNSVSYIPGCPYLLPYNTLFMLFRTAGASSSRTRRNSPGTSCR